MLEVWERAVEEKKPLPLIVPIIVYHGKTRWDLKQFSDSFEDWDESLRPYLPAFEYLLTDLSRLTDQAILGLDAQFLINVLILLKHQGDKDYIRANIRQIFFQLAGQNKIRMLLVYILFTTEFNNEDWDNLVEETPSPVKQLAMSTYDMLIKKGKEQGIELGKEQGIELGKEQGIELKAREVVLALLLEFPEFSDARIAALAKVEERFVKALRG
ncbi:MAG: Rpn family recombination-promoting nuclease/putative transposase [Saprospiraceae bacterium]